MMAFTAIGWGLHLHAIGLPAASTLKSSGSPMAMSLLFRQQLFYFTATLVRFTM